MRRAAVLLLLPLLGAGPGGAPPPTVVGEQAPVQPAARSAPGASLKSDPRIEAKLREAEALERAGKAPEALERYEDALAALEGEADPLFLPDAGGAAAEARRRCLGRIAALPAPLPARHAERDEPRARALAGRDPARQDDALLARAALLFPLCPTGRVAARILGDRALERGDAAEAAGWLAAAIDGGAADAALSFRLRAAEILAGLPPAGPDPPPGASVPFLGEPSDARAALARIRRPREAAAPFAPGARRWSVLLPDPPLPPRFRPLYEGRGIPLPMPIFPAAAAGRIWIQTAASLAVLDPADGRTLWRQPDAPPKTPWTALRGPDLRPSADGGRVAIVRERDLWVFDAETGRLLLRGRDLKPTRDLLDGSLALSAPRLAGDRVYLGIVLARGDAEHRLACLSARTGEILWTTRLATSAPFTHLGEAYAPSPPVLAGGRVYLQTNAGAIGCAEARTGAARWVARYESAPEGERRREVVEGRRATDPPAVAGPLLVALPRDGNEVLALDAKTGERRWSAPRQDATALLGAADDAVATAGERLRVLEAASGRVRALSPLPSPALAAGLLRGGEALVPVAEGIVRVSLADGSIRERSGWDGDAPGNLLLAEGRLLIATEEAIHAREAWDESERRLVAAGPAGAFEQGRLLVRRGAFEQGRRLLAAARNAAADDEGRARAEDEIRLSHIEEARHLSAAGRKAAAAESLERALPLAAAPEARRRTLFEIADAAAEAAPARACLALQEILDGGEGEARERARARLAFLLAGTGPGAYAPIEAKAASRLRAALKDRAAEPLLRVVRAFPHSRSAREAAAEGARRLLSEKRPAEALRFLEEAASEIPDADRDPALAARLVAAAIAAGEYARARRPLRTLAAASPETPVPDGDRTVTAAAAAEAARRILRDRPDDFDLGDARDLREAARTEVRVPNGLREDGSGESLFLPDEADPEADAPLYLYQPLSDAEGAPVALSAFDPASGEPLFRREVGAWRGRGILSRDALLLWEGPEILAVDPRTGAPRWKYTLRAAPAGEGEAAPPDPESLRFEPVRGRQDGIRTLALVGGSLVLATEGREVAAVDPSTGRALWRRPLPGPAYPRLLPGPKDTVLVLREDRPMLLGFAVRDGAPALEAELRKGAARLSDVERGSGGPDAPVYALYDSRRAVAADPADGKVRFDVELPRYASRLIAAPGRIVAVPAALAARTQEVVALDDADGRVVWRATLPALPSPRFLANRTTLFSVQDRWTSTPARVRAFDIRDGKPRFEVSDKSFDRIAGSASATDRLLLLAAPRASQVFLLGAEDGRTRREIGVPKGSPLVAAKASGNRLVLHTARSTIVYRNLPEERAMVLPIAAEERLGRAERPGAPREAREAARRGLSEALALEGRPREALGALGPLLANPTLAERETDRLLARVQALRERAAERAPPVYPALRFVKPPAVDGVLSEAWPEPLSVRLSDLSTLERIHLPELLPDPWRGRADLSAKVYLGWDDRSLYFAVDVDDAHHELYAHEDAVWRGDAVVLSFDPENDGGFGYGVPGRPADVVLTQALMKQMPQPGKQTTIPPGQYAVRRKPDESGTVYESEIPWTYFKQLRAGPGTKIGFNLKVLDDDGGGARKAMALSPGMILHHEKRHFSEGFAPAFFGKILLVEEPPEDPAGPAP